jgi:hypothetical protein
MITENYFIEQWPNVNSLLAVSKMRNFILENSFNMSSDLYEISLQACNGREKQIRETLEQTLTKF